MKKYALLGEKLGHSFSPIIHKEIFKEFDIDASYELKEISKEQLKETIDLIRNDEYQGFNVTIPYKIEVMKYLDEISDEAKSIGSVNTIAKINGKIVGFNTDYYGFYNELKYYNVDCKDKNCYILGTGGASLAINKALNDLGGNTLYVSRNPKNEFTISYEELKTRKIDVLVNTTPVGMYPNVDSCPIDIDTINRCGCVVDIIFNPLKTKLLKLAKSDMNGLFMLVGQAVKAEEIWQDRKYNGKIEVLLDKVREMI